MILLMQMMVLVRMTMLMMTEDMMILTKRAKVMQMLLMDRGGRGKTTLNTYKELTLLHS